jgi:putative transposase
MTTTRKRYRAKFKSRVAVEVSRGEKTLSQLAAQFQVHPVQIAQSKKSPWSNCTSALASNKPVPLSTNAH